MLPQANKTTIFMIIFLILIILMEDQPGSREDRQNLGKCDSCHYYPVHLTPRTG